MLPPQIKPPQALIAQTYCPDINIKNPNQLKVYKAYKNAVPQLSKIQKKKPKSIENAIERINLKIDDLNQNLVCYE